jgi:hypothetical protein
LEKPGTNWTGKVSHISPLWKRDEDLPLTAIKPDCLTNALDNAITLGLLEYPAF